MATQEANSTLTVLDYVMGRLEQERDEAHALTVAIRDRLLSDKGEDGLPRDMIAEKLATILEEHLEELSEFRELRAMLERALTRNSTAAAGVSIHG
jgi:hypothetical protein